MSARHITPVGAVVILEALKSAGAAVTEHPFDVTTPTAVAAFFNVHGDALHELLTSMSYVTVPVETPSAYDVLQMAHRLAAAGDREDAARLRRLADSMIAKATPSSPMWIGVDFAEGVTVDAAASLKALGEYMLALRTAYARTATGLNIEGGLAQVGQWLEAVSRHMATLEIDRIKPFPMVGMTLKIEDGEPLLHDPPRPAPETRSGCSA